MKRKRSWKEDKPPLGAETCGRCSMIRQLQARLPEQPVEMQALVRLSRRDERESGRTKPGDGQWCGERFDFFLAAMNPCTRALCTWEQRPDAGVDIVEWW